MQRIKINNFGPVKNVELEIKNFAVFIGPQASGKSTISKAIYFFRSIRRDVFDYILENIETGHFDKPLGNIAKRIRSKFLSLWGPTADMKDFELIFFYSPEKYIKINLKTNPRNRRKYVNPEFSQAFRTEFNKILDFIKTAEIRKYFQNGYELLSEPEKILIEQKRKEIIELVLQKINSLFEDDYELLFIPASRSLLTTLSDQLHLLHIKNLDLLIQQFVNTIVEIKPLFRRSITEQIEDKHLMSNDKIKSDFVYTATKIINKILGGSYKNDIEGEKLYIDKNTYVKINFSSSGQQEAIWILNLLFLSILNNRKLFLVVEEPEAHLYPEAQKDIIDLIALLYNATQSQIIITTHSPYILSSLNNLLYASSIGQKYRNKVKEIIDTKFWITPSSFVAYSVSNGKIRKITDPETRLIKVNEIDKVSETINDLFDKLFNIEANELMRTI